PGVVTACSRCARPAEWPTPRSSSGSDPPPRTEEDRIHMDIAGISAVVTGGASGLGLATVRHLLDKGAAHVVIADYAENGGEVAAGLGDQVSFVRADVRDESQVQAAVAAAVDVGPLRAVVHCAGR